MRGSAPKYFFHGDVFVAADRIVASTDVDPSTGALAGVHAFERDTGRELWRYRAAGRGVLGAVIGAGPRVFAYAANGDVIALNLESGTVAWTYPAKASAWDSPAVAGSRVVAGSTDGSVYALDAATGRVEWQTKLGAAVSTSVRAAGVDVYVGTADGKLHRLAASDGALRSSLKLDSTLDPASAPLVTPSAVLVLLVDAQADYRALVSLDPDLGRINWKHAAPDVWTTSRIFMTGRTVVLGTASGDVTAICANDGSSAWSQKMPSSPIRSVGGSDETLFVGTPQGALYAIRPPRACS